MFYSYSGDASYSSDACIIVVGVSLSELHCCVVHLNLNRLQCSSGVNYLFAI